MVEHSKKGPGAPQEGPGTPPLDEAELNPKERRRREQRDLRLDHVLRRVHESGFDNLGHAEMLFLERAAAELRYELGWDKSQPHHDESD